MANHLFLLDQFKQVLADYQPGTQAKRVLQATPLVLLVGPSSSGRNSIINELLKSGDYHYIISDTTRNPRVNNGVLEVNGREYWFRSEAEILADLKKGLFLEAAIIHNQQVSGISIRELEQAAQEHLIAINEIEVVGADNIHTAKPDAKFFFVIPPSVDEWLTRISARGELPVDEVRRRLTSAVTEITMALARDYYEFVVNDTFMQTAKKMHALIQGDKMSADEKLKAQATARQILQDIQQHLSDPV